MSWKVKWYVEQTKEEKLKIMKVLQYCYFHMEEMPQEKCKKNLIE